MSGARVDGARRVAGPARASRVARTLDALRNAGIYDRRLGGGLLGAQSGLSGSLSGEIVPPQGLLGVRLR
mgnify:CR=1 FL=1